MIIHLVGHAGCGKSAIAKALLAACPELRPQSRSEVGKVQLRAIARLFLPRYISIGRKLSAYNDHKKKTSSLLWSYKIAIEAARRDFGGKWLIDHGFTNTMRKKIAPINSDLACQLPFPDVIVNIGVSKAVRVARVIKRSKPLSKSRSLTGAGRHQMIRRHARQWLQIWPDEVVFDYLDAFNRRRCHPLFTETELRAIIAAERDAPLDELDQQALTYRPVPENYAWLKQIFVAQGGTWIDFENSGTSDLQQAAEDLLSRLHLR